MHSLVILALNLVCALAAPAPYVSVSPQITSTADIQIVRNNHVGILNQINEVNEDGSYTFGYESADGSFRIESRDVDGFVSGKYGYIDVNGEVQEFEYVAGSIGGRPLGYQARGTGIPVGTRGHTAQTFPVFPTQNSLAQKAIDYEYSSVDDDGDGFPDNFSNQGQNVVRLTTQAQSVLNNPSSIVRVVSTTQPTVVRLPAKTETTSNIVRVVNPATVSNSQQTIVRLPIQGEPQPNIVRINPGQVSTQQKQSNVVRLINPVSTQQQATLVQVPSTTQASVVRVVNPVQQVTTLQQPTVVRVRPQKKAKISSVVQSARLSTPGYQVVSPNRQRQTQYIQQVNRSPVYSGSSYGGQQFVTRTRNPVVSSSQQFNPFLNRFGTRNNVGSVAVRGNQFSGFTPSFQTVVVDDDDFDFDFDDLNDFDDDDSFIVNSPAFVK